MIECPFPNYDNYLRYAAYVEVRDNLMSILRSRNVARPSAGTVCKILGEQEHVLINKHEVLPLSTLDDVETLLAKKFTTELLETYSRFITEASDTYASVLSKYQRTTIAHIESVMNDKVQAVTNDLLEMI